MTDEGESGQAVMVLCPHCAGPLTLRSDGAAECREGHKFLLDDATVEQTRAAARASWQAVHALESRAETTRWVLTDDDVRAVGDVGKMREELRADQELATVLRGYAQKLDLAIGRMSRPSQTPAHE